jgi:tryptophan 2,3-dioxygenase
MPVTYSNYLRLDELLNIQSGLSEGPEHDEMLFIIIHQVYELWFKQVLHELDFLADRLESGDLPRALHTLKRVLTILKIMVAQLDVLETMTPLEFLSFRDRLESASGFQSGQFRELEFALGYKRLSALVHYPEGSAARLALEKRYAQRTVWDAFLSFLAASGLEPPAALLERNVTKQVEAEPQLQRVLVTLYRQHPSLVPLCERLVDLDEGIQEWRYRHMKMVERTIGSKIGTGGSSGVGYLHGTLGKPLFPDLWEIRSEL